MCKATSAARLIVTLLLVSAAGAPASAQLGLLNPLAALDPLLQQHASLPTGRSRIIIRASDPGALG
jgi:hypothetical protein